MNIPDTTTEAGRVEASILLAELCGWITSDGLWHRYMPPSGAGACVNHAKGQEITTIFALCPTLYNPANMALAWRVLNWAFANFVDIWLEETFRAWVPNPLYTLPPADAQRAWLDKILTLAIEAGMLP